MTTQEIERKQLVLIQFLQNTINDNSWKFKAEYSTNDDDKKVIVVQEQTGQKVVFYGDITPLYNYYLIDIFGTSIREAKNMSLLLGYLIGTNNTITYTFTQDNKEITEKWQIIIKQFSNFQPIEYQDIRRVGYTGTMQCIVNKIS
jgi:hypothetical protein